MAEGEQCVPSAIEGVLEVCLYAPDLRAARDFYLEVLRLPCFSECPGRFYFFDAGATRLLLFNPEASRQGGHDLPPHGAEGPSHVALRVPPSAIDGWRCRLESCGVAVELDYEWPGGYRSLYFRDPAGNSIELAPAAIWRGQG